MTGAEIHMDISLWNYLILKSHWTSKYKWIPKTGVEHHMYISLKLIIICTKYGYEG
jgi:hypothetical protein